jgi:hypothetical protein
LEIVCEYGEEAIRQEDKLNTIVLSACEDINWKVRKLGCQRLSRIIPKIIGLFNEDEEMYTDYIELLLQLSSDEENLVKVDAIQSIILSLKHFKLEDVKEKFMPIIKEQLEREVEDNDEFIQPMSEI